MTYVRHIHIIFGFNMYLTNYIYVCVYVYTFGCLYEYACNEFKYKFIKYV